MGKMVGTEKVFRSHTKRVVVSGGETSQTISHCIGSKQLMLVQDLQLSRKATSLLQENERVCFVPTVKC